MGFCRESSACPAQALHLPLLLCVWGKPEPGGGGEASGQRQAPAGVEGLRPVAGSWGAWPWPCCAGNSPGCQGSERPGLPALWVRGHPWVPLPHSLGVLQQQDSTAWCSKPQILKVLLVPLPDPQLAALEVAVPEGGDFFRQEKICTQLSC